MLKSVGYEGFEGRPGLREQVERITSIVADELGTGADRVSLLWEYLPAEPDQPEKVRLMIKDDWVSGSLSTRFLTPELADERDIRARVRRLHGSMLDGFLRQQVERMKENWTQPTEA